MHGDLNKLSHANENGSIRDSNSFGYQAFSKEEPFPIASTSQQSRFLDQRLDGPKRSFTLSTLRDIVRYLEFQLWFIYFNYQLLFLLFLAWGWSLQHSYMSRICFQCTMEGLSLVFKTQSPLPTGSNHQGEVYAQVSISRTSLEVIEVWVLLPIYFIFVT